MVKYVLVNDDFCIDRKFNVLKKYDTLKDAKKDNYKKKLIVKCYLCDDGALSHYITLKTR